MRTFLVYTTNMHLTNDSNTLIRCVYFCPSIEPGLFLLLAVFAQRVSLVYFRRAGTHREGREGSVWLLQIHFSLHFPSEIHINSSVPWDYTPDLHLFTLQVQNTRCPHLLSVMSV